MYYICTCARPVGRLKRFELKIMTTNNGSGFCGMRGARRGKRISYIIIYSNIILLCEIVLPIIMLKCRLLIIIIISRSSIVYTSI